MDQSSSYQHSEKYTLTSTTIPLKESSNYLSDSQRIILRFTLYIFLGLSVVTTTLISIVGLFLSDLLLFIIPYIIMWAFLISLPIIRNLVFNMDELIVLTSIEVNLIGIFKSKNFYKISFIILLTVASIFAIIILIGSIIINVKLLVTCTGFLAIIFPYLIVGCIFAKPVFIGYEQL